MSKRNSLLSILIFLLFIFNGCNYINTSNTSTNAEATKELKIYYFDVGQGDSCLIQVNGKNMLIDAGPRSESNFLKKKLKNLNIKTLDYVIATHPHEDHIGGMPKIIDNFSIGKFIAPKVTSNTSTFKNMIMSLLSKNLKITTAKAGNYIDMGDNITCQIIAPNNDNYEDLNDYSVVIRLVYKDTSFIFQGDANSFSEKEILKAGYDIDSDVIKIGHHGSRSSSTVDYLKNVSPNIAIISCGKNNKYNHPHKQTLTKLEQLKCKLYRTDIEGTIILISDGENIYRK